MVQWDHMWRHSGPCNVSRWVIIEPMIYCTDRHSALWAEWAKSKACAEWWEEEVILLCKEMCCCLAYCHWKERWWMQQQVLSALQLPEDDPLCGGLEAYAKQQAVQELMILNSWVECWLPVRQWAKPVLQRLLGDSLPEGFDVGDPTGETFVVDLEDEEMEQGLDNIDQIIILIDGNVIKSACQWIYIKEQYINLHLASAVMSLLNRYAHIPVYFHFSFTSYTSLIHHYAPHTDVTACDRTHTHMTIALASSDWSRLFDGHMISDSHVLLLFLVFPMCTLPQSDQSWALAPCSQALTIASLQMSLMLSLLLQFIFNLPVFTFHSTEEPQPIAYTSFPQNSELALTPCIAPHLPWTISHCIALPCNPTVFTLLHTWRQSLTPRSHPQSPIGFILRSPAP